MIMANKAVMHHYSLLTNHQFMQHTMRWYGPNDPVTLTDIAQAGCTGIVTALHHIPNGEVWSPTEIKKRLADITQGQPTHWPLEWSVVESLPVHEDIKQGKPARDEYIAHYQASLENLAAGGVTTVCYNFMPVLDWSRTDLAYEVADGSRALRFVATDFALFDLHLLQRPGAEADYDEATRRAARDKFEQLDPAEKERLTRTILQGLPGAEESFTLGTFQSLLDQYAGIDAHQLRQHLAYFLRAVVPVAERVGVRLAIHPDDPPRPLLGLPRIVSTEADLEFILNAADSPSNGLTLCTGSLGVRPDNDLVGIMERHGARIHFLHLRSTQREAGTDNFHEADHLAGDVDMYGMVQAVAREERRRQREGQAVTAIPMRPDHGHQMLDDLQKNQAYPGYTAIGRLRGLAELRGVAYAVQQSMR